MYTFPERIWVPVQMELCVDHVHSPTTPSWASGLLSPVMMEILPRQSTERQSSHTGCRVVLIARCTLLDGTTLLGRRLGSCQLYSGAAGSGA